MAWGPCRSGNAEEAAGDSWATHGGDSVPDGAGTRLGQRPLEMTEHRAEDAIMHLGLYRHVLLEAKLSTAGANWSSLSLEELARGLDEVVYGFGEAERAAAIGVARRLRESGASVDLVLGQPKPKRVFADADRAGATRVWLIGPEEAERGVSRVKHLESGEQTDVAFGQEQGHLGLAPAGA